MNIRWTSPAREDLTEILDYIAADDPSAALATLDRIEKTTSRLAGFPLSGRAGSVTGTRELPLAGIPFIVVYQIGEDAVEVLRVLHDARRWP